MDLVLIKLVKMDFNRILSALQCRYLGFIGGCGFNQIGGHGFQ